ncbi:hypothetical protein [Fulvimarina pelagi]|nr:hypothetical protein [Fulvimarina pelagi]BAT30932.1 hypothetical protein [Fulvimarina pelagi]
MRKLLLATSIIALGMSPALAQTGDSPSDMTNGSTGAAATSESDAAPPATSESTTGATSNAPMSTEDMVASQEKVLNALEEAGYTDAEIMDAAYMVQAQTPDGEQVLMMIDTSGRVMGAQRAPESGAAANGSSSSTDSMDSESGSGSMDDSSNAEELDGASN